jgi:hypothetical protein
LFVSILVAQQVRLVAAPVILIMESLNALMLKPCFPTVLTL